MKILIENKEDLPVSFLTDFISDGWEKIGYLQSDIENLNKDFRGTKEITKIIQNLVDAYVVCIGQLEGIIEDKKIIKNIKPSIKENINQTNTTTPKPTAQAQAQQIGATNAADKAKQNDNTGIEQTSSKSSATKQAQPVNSNQPKNVTTSAGTQANDQETDTVEEDWQFSLEDSTEETDDYELCDEFPEPVGVTDKDIYND